MRKLAGLGKTLEGIFRSLFSDDEWSEFEACSRNITERNEAQIRTERLRRQKAQLEKCAQLVIDLTIRDEDVQEEQATLAAESLEVMQSFLKAAGLTGRLRPTLKVMVVRPTSDSESSKEEEQEKPERPKRTGQKKRPERQEEAETEKAQRKKKTKVVEEEQQEEESVSEAEEEQDAAMDTDMLEEIEKKLVLAAEDATMLREQLGLIHVGSIHNLRFHNVAPPDISLASEEKGAALVREPNLLKGILEQEVTVNVQHDNDLIEKLGKLLSWWKVVRQALALAGIFAHLKNGGGKRRRGRGKLMKQRFEEVVSSISYTQAKKYARIGELVCAFPQLLYQTQFVLVVQWMTMVKLADGTARAFVDLFPKLLNEEQVAFWQVDPPESDAEVPLLCKVCSSRDRGHTWTCDGCGFQFHNVCAGYPPGKEPLSRRFLLSRPTRGRAKVPPVTEFVTVLYCADCLDKNDADMNAIVKSVSEKRAVADFLNQNDCPFSLERVPGDGYCIFRILEDFAKARLGMSWSSETFCKKLAESAIKSIEEARKQTGDDSLDGETITVFRKLARETGRVGMLKRGLWRDLETQHVLNGYVSLFERRVRVHTYQNDKGKLKETGVYSGGGEGNIQELHVQHWAVSEHYDELVTI